ncbi:MAG: hypothetical protein LBC19_06040, partial [Tannerella sp.]|nr:hypothetical protein [Tannerella sp.]
QFVGNGAKALAEAFFPGFSPILLTLPLVLTNGAGSAPPDASMQHRPVLRQDSALPSTAIIGLR